MEKYWIKKTFDDCIDKVKVKTKLPSSAYCKDGKYPIISQEKELISGYWDCADDVISTAHPVTIFGDHTMVAKYINFDFVVGADGVKILQPKTFLNPRFFYYWVCSVNIPSRGYARHYRYLRERNVEYPSSLDEQQRIVDILDKEFEKIDTLKANAEKGLQYAKDLFQSALKQELQPKDGWITKTIEELSEDLFAGGDVPRESFSKTQNDDYNIPIYANAVENNGLYGYTNRARVIKPSITIAGRGSGTGYVIERNESYFPVVRLIVLIPNEFVLNKYLYYALKALNIKSNGSAIPQLTVPMIAQYKINFPKSLDEQNTIICLLDRISEYCKTLQANYEKTIALCDEMKQALLRKAFNGEF